MTIRKSKIIHFLFKPLIIISLALMLGLSIYSLAFTNHIKTPWDDANFRTSSITEAKTITKLKAFVRVSTPNPRRPIAGRTRGYHQVLVFGIKFLDFKNTELSLQVVNFLLYLAQGIIIFLFARWATSDYLLAIAITFLYLSSPFVFGLSRWVMSENFVFVGLLTFSFMPAWLITKGQKFARTNELVGGVNRKEIINAALVAYSMGILATVREYVIPSLLVMTFCTVVALILARRKLAAITFTAVLFPFLWAVSKPVYVALKATLMKGKQSQYFHSIGEWIPHAILYGFGIALTILIATLLILILSEIIKNIRSILPRQFSHLKDILKNPVTGLYILLAGHGFLLFLYSGILFLSSNRVIRPGIPIMMSVLGFVLIGIRILPSLKSLLLTDNFKAFILTLILISWGSLFYQLFIAFDGGKTYAHHAFRLEYYNYPLHLRSLRNSQDTYICGTWGITCPYDK